jgi:hypothetical protein
MLLYEIEQVYQYFDRWEDDINGCRDITSDPKTVTELEDAGEYFVFPELDPETGQMTVDPTDFFAQDLTETAQSFLAGCPDIFKLKVSIVKTEATTDESSYPSYALV